MPKRKRVHTQKITCREARENRAIHAAACWCGWCRHVQTCNRKGCAAVRSRTNAVRGRAIARRKAEDQARRVKCPECGQQQSIEPVNGWPGAAMRVRSHDDRTKRGRRDKFAASIGFNYVVYPTCGGSHAPANEQRPG